MLLEEIKALTNIEPLDSSKDIIIGIYIKRAIVSIQNYLNNEKYTREFIGIEFQEAIVYLVVSMYEKKGLENIKSKSQGSRSVTFTDATSFAITEDISNLLPTPTIRMR